MLLTARDRMAKLVKQGKSEADVVAAKPFADLDAKWAPSDQASTNFIRVVYHSLADNPSWQDSQHSQDGHRLSAPVPGRCLHLRYARVEQRRASAAHFLGAARDAPPERRPDR